MFCLLIFLLYLVLQRMFPKAGVYLLFCIADVIVFLVVLAVALNLMDMIPGGNINVPVGSILLTVYGPLAAVSLVAIIILWRYNARR